MTKITLPFRLPSLNEYIRAERANRYAAAKMKKDCQTRIAWYLDDVPPVRTPVILRIEWMERTARRDNDNIAFGKKFILDALVASGILPDDSRKWVRGFSETFPVGQEDRITIYLEEREEHGREGIQGHLDPGGNLVI